MLTRPVMIVAFTLCLSTLVVTAEINRVDGFYMVDGKTTQLKYAYPAKYVSQEGTTLKSVLFSAGPVSAEDLKSDDPYSTFSRKARAGEVQALQVIFKPDKTVKQIHIYDKALDGALQTNFGKFETTRFDSTGVTGKIIMDSPKSFIKQTFQYSMSFSVNWVAAT